MIQRLLVIQLTEMDMAQLLMLVENEAVSQKAHTRHWAKILEKMRSQINPQLAGQFFQCAACTDTPSQPLNFPPQRGD